MTNVSSRRGIFLRLSTMKRSQRDTVAGFLFALPALIVLAVFMFYPAVRLFVMSVTEIRVVAGVRETVFIGMDNFNWIFNDPIFFQSLTNSFYFPLVVTPIQGALALFVAILLSSDVKAVGFFRTVYFIPVVMSFVIVAMFWSHMMNTNFGVINLVLGRIGLEPVPWLTSTSMSRPSIAIVSMWKGWGWYMVLFLAALNTIDRELYDSGSIDGTNAWQRFIYITVPCIRNALLFAVIISTMNNIRVFTPIMIMTDGGPMNSTRVIVHYIWSTAFRGGNFGRAAAMAVILFFVIMGITLIQYKLMSEKD